MNEKKSNQNLGSLKYLLVLVGVIALVASYFLVFSKYRTENEEIEAEIEELQERCDDLELKNRNKDTVLKNTEENNEKIEEILSKFDGGLSYQAEIVDLQNFINDNEGIDVPTLTIAAPTDVYTFVNGNIGKAITYNYASTGTYDQMKEAIKYFSEYKGKRKVPSSIAFVYDYAEQKVTLSFSVTEYAVTGEGREQKTVSIPEYTKGNLNIFYDEVITIG